MSGEPTRAEWVELDVDDGTRMGAHVTRPAADGPRPGMLLLQEALGVGPQLRGVAARRPFVDVEFSEAAHAFFNERTERYNAPSAAQSWAVATAFLEDALA